MKINLLIIWTISLLAVFSCKLQAQVVYTTYTEPKDPGPLDTIGWNNVPGGIVASFGSINTGYESSKPALQINDTWEGYNVNKTILK